jgi:hypothetical protein
MLININKGMASGDVVSLKLINGEELVARYDSETEDTIKINKPLCITLNGQGLGMMPWMFLGNSEEVTFKKSHVFAIMPCKKDAAIQYRESTSDIALR